jgi:hypothetical protein
MVLQGVLSLMLALVFIHYRPQLEQVEHWRFGAKRPIAAGLLVGVVSGLVFYESLPDMVRLGRGPRPQGASCQRPPSGH